MSFPAKGFQKDYVPFVGSTAAANLRRSGGPTRPRLMTRMQRRDAEPTTQEQGVAAAAKRISLFSVESGFARTAC